MNVIIAPKARSDIASILAWTQENFGPQTLKRYGTLLQTAMEEVAANPDLAGSIKRPEIADNCRTYHLFFRRKNIGGRGHRIRNRRHFLLYRVTESDVVEIGRVLHESMELDQHLPDEFRDMAE